jgi:hypothetical protein
MVCPYFLDRLAAVMPLPGYLPHRLAMDKIFPPDNLFLLHRQPLSACAGAG